MEDSNSAQVKIKLGSIEIEYHGSEGFIKEDLPNLLKVIIGTYKESFPDAPLVPLKDHVTDDDEDSLDKQKLEMTTSSIASKLGCKTGTDLALAACAHLALVKHKLTFTRKDILLEMQSASTFYSISYRKSLTDSLSALMNGDKLLERVKNTYSLHEKTLREIEDRLVGK